MNLFDLEEWKRQNITDVYHSWQKLVSDLLEDAFLCRVFQV
jgi:alpha-1,4-galacturonosyltransferase